MPSRGVLIGSLGSVCHPSATYNTYNDLESRPTVPLLVSVASGPLQHHPLRVQNKPPPEPALSVKRPTCHPTSTGRSLFAEGPAGDDGGRDWDGRGTRVEEVVVLIEVFKVSTFHLSPCRWKRNSTCFIY